MDGAATYLMISAVIFHILVFHHAKSSDVIEENVHVNFSSQKLSFKNDSDGMNATEARSDSPESCFNESCGCPYVSAGPLVQCSYL